MKYPYLFYSPNIANMPVFKLEGEPFALDLSTGNELLLQIITQIGLERGFLHKGYCAEEELRVINDFCPDPLHLFRI